MIDLAGGLVIHVSAGTSALVAALYLGKRYGFPHNTMNPNNLVMTLMGAGFLWVGWFGFNAGSTIHSGLDTARALTMTQVSASSGAFTWMIIESVKFRKVTSLGFVSGILAGLVVITPAAGVVLPYGAFLLGAASSLICFYALALSFLIRQSWMDSATTRAGSTWTAIDQFLVQLKGMGVTILLSGVVTIVLCVLIEKTVGFHVNKAQELAGLDHSQHRESGYGLMNLN